MPRYSTVLFDLFDTLVRFDRDRLPVARIDGREVHTSVACLYPAVAVALPGISIEAFYDAFMGSYREAERRRELDHREIPALARLGFCYARLGIDPATVPAAVSEQLITLHMTCLAGAAEPLPGRPELLDWLAGRYRLGLVSNFDYTPTVQRILAEGGILDRFDAVVVSDSVGWRKPSPAIFQVAFDRLGVGPRECLFIGDRPEIDVAGAKGVGMDAAWFNPAGTPPPAEAPEPDFVLGRLADLRAILEKTA
ncbi:MAG TPA: HAD family hydrolase [Methylomirabilota bacterium]|jgi:FMN phosphatase YigB (HAD superfamily)|nr:HAD family hydrolase [Methylomirabilota bacterium]